jgi:hypothetical protein
MRPLSSNRAENYAKASSFLDRAKAGLASWRLWPPLTVDASGCSWSNVFDITFGWWLTV